MNIVVFVVWGVLLKVKAEIRTIVAILRTFPGLLFKYISRVKHER